MPARTRVYVPIGTKEYSRLWGVSERTARRRLAALPGAVKTGRGWKVPILATDVAKQSGKSVRSIRAKGIRAATANDASLLVGLPPRKVLQKEALDNLTNLTSGRVRQNKNYIQERITKASPKQLDKGRKLTDKEWRAILAGKDKNGIAFGGKGYTNPDWEGSDGVSILYYH